MSLESFQLGVVASALGDDPRQIPRMARTLGFRGVQFDARLRGLDLTELSGTGRREFLRILNDQEQKLIGLRFDLGNKGFGQGADLDQLLDRLDKVFEAAANMGSPLVCIETGPLPAPPRLARPKPVITTDQLGLLLLPPTTLGPEPEVRADPPTDPKLVSQVDAAFSALGQKADRYNVVAAFRSDLASFASIERTLQAARCPWFGVDLDPASIMADEWTWDEVFSRLGPSIRHVRARDAVGGADRRTRPAILGTGSVDWAQLLADLNASDYHGWITLDPAGLPDPRAASAAGRKLLAALQIVK